MKVAVFGMGYVGCVTAACLSRDGHQVYGVDIDQEKVATINRGGSPVAEPGLPELIQQQIAAGRLRATTSLADAVSHTEVALIAVGTPSASDGSVDLTAVKRVVASIAAALSESEQVYTIVVRSTLLPGCLEEELLPVVEQALIGKRSAPVHLCNNPEFLRETTAIADYQDPPFVVVGAADASAAQQVLDLYAPLSAERIVTDTRSAAMVKYACNAFHALKIVFANEIGTLSRSLGASGSEVMRIVCRDDRLNISPAYLRPGFAFGGSCLPKDVRALVRHAQKQAIDAELLSAINVSNESHMQRALQLVRDSECRRIGMAGLSFKAGTDDLRESPQVILAETLLGRGYQLRVYDPHVRIAGLTGTNLSYVDRHLPHLAALLTDSVSELFEHAELLLLGTDVANDLDLAGFDGTTLDLRSALVEPGVIPEAQPQSG